MRIACYCAGLICVAFAYQANGDNGSLWRDRVIPLPREMEVEDVCRSPASEIRYEIKATDADAPPLRTARAHLNAFARGGESASGVVVTLLDRDAAVGQVADPLLNRLSGLPNADQAYLIVSESGTPTQLRLVANTAVGLLYAASTLHQLVMPPAECADDVVLEIPVVTVVDWPDIAERGEWGTSPLWSLDWLAGLKFNMLKIPSRSYTDSNASISRFEFGGGGRIRTMQPLIERCDALGYRLIPYLGHVGELGRRWKGVAPIVPDPESEGSHQKGFCWSDPTLVRLIAEHIDRMADPLSTRHAEVEVWLNESGETDCYCAACAGRNGYIMEAEVILKAFARVRESRPGLRLRLLLTQGTRSAEVNDEIIEMLPPDVGLAHYDGHVTYRLDRSEIIPATLADWARRGGRLDVVPAVTPWNGIFPASMPQFIQFRLQEMVDKDVGAVTAFAPPDRFHFPMNMMALAEYSWNASGRSPRDFARAYAVRQGLPDPERVARWAVRAGEAVWTLTEMNSLPQLAEGNPLPRIPDEERFRAACLAAEEALVLARQSHCPWMQLESESTHSALHAVVLIREIEERLRSEDHLASLGDALRLLDRHAHRFRAVQYRWARLTLERKQREVPASFPWGAPHPRWFWIGAGGALRPDMTPATYALLRTCDELVTRAEALGVPDPRGDTVPREVLNWTPERLQGDQAELEVDLKPWVPPTGGAWHLGVDLVEGANVRLGSLTLRRHNLRTSEDTEILHEDNLLNAELRKSRMRHTSSFEYELNIPPRSDDETMILTIELRDPGSGSHGRVMLRKTWSYEAFPPSAIPSDRILPMQARRKIYVSGDSMSTSFGWPKRLQEMTGCDVFSSAEGGSCSPSQLDRTRGVVLAYPIRGRHTLEPGPVTVRLKRANSNRLRNRTPRYKAEWPSMAKTVSEPDAVEVYNNGELIGFARRQQHRVTTAYAGNPKTLFWPGHPIQNGSEVVIFTKDHPDEPRNITTATWQDDRMWQSPWMPPGVTEKRIYWAANVSEDGFELKELPNDAETIDLGGDASGPIHVELGWYLDWDYPGGDWDITFASRTRFDDWILVTHCSANDIPEARLPAMDVTIPNTLAHIATQKSRPPEFLVVMPATGTYPGRGPGSYAYTNYWDVYRPYIQNTFPDRHIDTMALLEPHRLAQEIDLLESPDTPRLVHLRGTTTDPATWEAFDTDQGDTIETWIGPGFTPIQFRRQMRDRIHFNAAANELIARAILGWLRNNGWVTP